MCVCMSGRQHCETMNFVCLGVCFANSFIKLCVYVCVYVVSRQHCETMNFVCLGVCFANSFIKLCVYVCVYVVSRSGSVVVDTELQIDGNKTDNPEGVAAKGIDTLLSTGTLTINGTAQSVTSAEIGGTTRKD